MSDEMAIRRQLADSMAAAASALLQSLDDTQREAMAWPFPADVERRLWFYTPTDHGGLPLSGMRPAQQRLAMRLLASGLSRAGYVTASTIIGLDNVLDELEGWVMTWGRERGRDPGMYYVRIFGDPAIDRNWSWRFGGHHVSVNHTVLDGSVAAVTPMFFGADPASSPLLGSHPLRPLGGAEDLAREFVSSLTKDQREIAVVSQVAPVDLVGANRSLLGEGNTPLSLADVWRGHFAGALEERVHAIQASQEQAIGLLPHHIEAVRYTTEPKGVRVAALSTSQHSALRKLLDVYLGRMPDALAEVEAAKYDGNRIETLSFLWAGGIDVGDPHYYRVQGPRIVLEYDNTVRNANHVHTVWRDPLGDFGADVLAQHYNASH